MFLRNNIGIITIILLFLLSEIAFLSFYDDVWWDSSVYIGMGKYIFSSGNSGLWEESRPLLFPFILGLGWFLGLDTVIFGRVVSMVFAILVVYMTYLIGIKLFSKNIGLLAAFFTAFSYNFIFFSPNILTAIPSTLFVLLAFYFYLKNRFFLMGLFSGIAITIRFFQVVTLIGLALVFVVHIYRQKSFYTKFLYSLYGFSIVILPYILLNYILYTDIFTPLKVQLQLTKTTGWMLHEGFGFYFSGLFNENFFLIFLLTIPFFIRI